MTAHAYEGRRVEMKWILIGMAVFAAPFLFVAAAPPAPAAGEPAAVSDDAKPSADAAWCTEFTDPKTLENDWKFDGSRFLVPRTRFYIGSEPTASKGKVMVVEADKATGVMLAAPSKVDLTKTPVMRWRWRVVKPIALKVGEEDPDDQAVVVYFGDGTLLKQRCVGYRWEVNTPVGHSGLRKYAAGMMTVSHKTVRNRTTPAGVWVTEEHNVVEDYRRAYGKMPDSYFIISVGANSQYSGSTSRAEIDFIEFIPVREQKDAQKR